LLKTESVQFKSTAPIIVVRDNGGLVFASDSVYPLLELTISDELSSVEKCLSDFIAQQQTKDRLYIRQGYSADNANSRCIVTCNNKKNILVEASEISMAIENYGYIVYLLRDVSDEIEKNKSIELFEKRFRIIVENLSDIAVTWMSTPGIEEMLYVNKGYEIIWGRSRESLYGSPQSFIELIHPEDKQRVLAHLKEHSMGNWDIDYRIIRDDGQLRNIHDTGKGVFNNQLELEFLVGTAVDITVQHDRRAELEFYTKKLERLSQYDDLTNIFNRKSILLLLSEALDKYKRYNHISALIFVDIKNFKTINDLYGHLAGDVALVELARLFSTRLRSSDNLARYGGDEFIILLTETSYSNASKLFQSLSEEKHKIEYENKNIYLEFDYGISMVNHKDISTVDDWIKLADTKMYKMKRFQLKEEL